MISIVLKCIGIVLHTIDIVVQCIDYDKPSCAMQWACTAYDKLSYTMLRN